MTCRYLYKNECYNEAPWLLFECVWVTWGGLGLGRDEDNIVHVLIKVFSFPPGQFVLLLDGWIGVLGTEVFHIFLQSRSTYSS